MKHRLNCHKRQTLWQFGRYDIMNLSCSRRMNGPVVGHSFFMRPLRSEQQVFQLSSATVNNKPIEPLSQTPSTQASLLFNPPPPSSASTLLFLPLPDCLFDFQYFLISHRKSESTDCVCVCVSVCVCVCVYLCVCVCACL